MGKTLPGKKLQKMLENILFDQENDKMIPAQATLCDAKVLERLWPADYMTETRRDLDATTQLSYILKFRTAVRLVGALASGQDRESIGFIVFWLKFLEPQGRRVVPSLPNIMRHALSREDDLIEAVIDLLKGSKNFQHRDYIKSGDTFEKDLSKKFHVLFNVLRGPKDQSSDALNKIIGNVRRTWANYYDLALDILAVELRDLAPEPFKQSHPELKHIVIQQDIQKFLNSVDNRETTSEFDELDEPNLPEQKLSNDERKIGTALSVPESPAARLEALGEVVWEGGGADGDESETSLSLPYTFEHWLRLYFNKIAQYTLSVCGHHDVALGVRVPINVFVHRWKTLQTDAGTTRTRNDLGTGSLFLYRRVFLVAGLPGSGRTSELKRMGFQCALEWLDHTSNALPIYIDNDLLRLYSSTRQSIYDLIIDQIFEDLTPEEAELLKRALKRLDEVGLLYVIVDDIDHLSQPDRMSAIDQLLFSKTVVISTLISNVPEIFSRFSRYKKNPEILRLENLSGIEQEEMINKLIGWYVEFDFDLALANQLLLSVPFLVESPLGVMAIFSQLISRKTRRFDITSGFINETLNRAGFYNNDLASKWQSRTPIVQALIKLGRTFDSELFSDLASSWVIDKLAVTNLDFKMRLSSHDDIRVQWDLLKRSGLATVEIAESDVEVIKFCNADVLCWFVAQNSGYSFPDAVRRENASKYPHIDLARQMMEYLKEREG